MFANHTNIIENINIIKLKFYKSVYILINIIFSSFIKFFYKKFYYF